jgi:hypothetical protein
VTAAVGFIALAMLPSACSKAAAGREPAAGAATPVGTVLDVMRGIVNPSATALWDSVGTESNEKGIVEKAPKTDEDWSTVEHQALTLAEAANLLTTPGRPLARPEEAGYKSKPDAPELTPAEIEKKIAAHPAEWATGAKNLQNAAVKALAAAKAKSKDQLIAVGEEIDNACESCHKIYWYPDDLAQKG